MNQEVDSFLSNSQVIQTEKIHLGLNDSVLTNDLDKSNNLHSHRRQKKSHLSKD